MGAPKSSATATPRPSLNSDQKQKARNAVAQVFVNSKIEDRVGEYPKFVINELQLGKLLGKGGFGSVFEIRSFTLSGKKIAVNKKEFSDDLDTTDHMYNLSRDNKRQESARLFIAQHCLRNNSDARYAVKMLSPEVIKDPGMCFQGMKDMALETRFMSDIQHTNIVKIRAMGQCDPFDEKYFIVMDRLYDTLERRIQKVWLPKSKRSNGMLSKLTDSKGKKKDALFEERIVYAYDLAAAVAYLHDRQIIYRDLKPENIGFDCRDDIKLFDFGLAKELRDELRAKQDGLYNLTGDTGSPRYMAPEVALSKPYNGTCDTYSFCILFWQMLSLTTPFEVYTIKKLKERVWSSMEKRPLVSDSWSLNVKLLLKRGWANDVSQRFTMKQVEGILRKECVRVRDGDDAGLEHNRRRSTFVFRGSKSGEKGGPLRASVEKKLEPKNKMFSFRSATSATMMDCEC